MSRPSEEATADVFPVSGDQARQLLTVARALSRAVTRADVKAVILEQAVQGTGAYGGTLISIVDEQTLFLVGSTGYGQPIELTWQYFAPDPSFPVVTAIKEKCPVFATLDDLRRDYPAFVPMLQPATRAIAAIPLIARGEVLSAITLSFSALHDITPDRQSFMQNLVDLCAEALERGRLHDAQHRARERATVLSEASSVLASSLDVHETLERITSQVIAHVSDWCAVYRPDENARPRLVAVAHQEPGRIELLRSFLARFPSNPDVPGTVAWVMRTGQEILVPTVPPAMIEALPSQEQRDAVRELGLHSLIQVPMNVRGRRIGVLSVASSRPSRTYGQDDLDFVRELAARAAMALDNAALHEAALASEQRYRSLVDATRQTVWTTSPDGELLDHQPSWARLTGQLPEAFQGYGWTASVHPEDRERTVTVWRAAVTSRSAYDVRHRVRVADGSYRHFHSRSVPVSNPDGSVREWVGVSTDVSEQVEAEQALRDREERYRVLVEHAAVGVTRTDRDGRWVDVNHAAEVFLGYSREELLTMTFQDLTHPDDRREGPSHPYRRLVAGEHDTFTIEKRYVRKDGQQVWAATTVSAVRDEAGVFQYAVAVLNDITQRRQAEEQVRQLARVVEESNDFVAIARLDGRAMYVNPAGRALIGLSEANVAAAKLTDCFLPEDLEFVQEVILPTTLTQGRWSGDFRFRHQGTNEAIDVNYNQFVVTNPTSGTPVAFATVTRDVRERKRIEAEVRALNQTLERRVEERTVELQRANAELARSNAELERFAFVASHDLQEPLRSIASFTEVLHRKYGDTLDDRGREYLRFVTGGAERMKTLIDDLLVFSRLNAVHEPFGQADTGEALGEALSRLHASVERTDARIIHDALPVLRGAPGELVQLFQNLIGNAIKFRREGVPPEVRVGARLDDGEWHFWVADNGIGIDPQYHERVFGLFQRLHVREKYEGTGLGLAIVRKIVERHGGQVWLESRVGRGTTVHFTLRGPQEADGD